MVESKPYSPHSDSTSSAIRTQISRQEYVDDHSGSYSLDRPPRDHVLARRMTRRPSQTSSSSNMSRSKVPRRRQSKPVQESPTSESLALAQSTSSLSRKPRSEQDSKRHSSTNGHVTDRRQVERQKEPRTPHLPPKYRSETSTRDRSDLAAAKERSHRSGESRIPSRMRPMNAPSVLSLLSGITSATGSSSGSNSTITQNSYEKSKYLEPRRLSRPKKLHSENNWRERSPLTAHDTQSTEHIDVFNYLDTGSSVHENEWLSDSSSPSSPSSSSSSSDNEHTSESMDSSRTLSKPGLSVVIPSAPDAPSWENHDQLQYDSGISICASSPESSRILKPLRKQPRFENVVEEKAEDWEVRDKAMTGVSPAVIDDSVNQHFSTSGPTIESYYPPAYYPPPYMPAMSMYGRRSSGNSSQHSESPAPGQRRKLLGYESLASQLSAHPHETEDTGKTLTPLYRKFETLNHRILLHLQDEISELEDQLKSIDEYIALDPGQNNKPASRRSELHHGNELHFRRTELLGHIFLKTSQYNQALTAYTTLTRSTTPASPTALNAYRTYVTQHAPIVAPETAFLDHQADLLAFSCACSSDSSTAHSTLPSFLALLNQYPVLRRILLNPVVADTAPCVASALFLLLLAFLLLPLSLMTMLIIVVLTGSGGMVLWIYNAVWTPWERMGWGTLLTVGCILFGVIGEAALG